MHALYKMWYKYFITHIILVAAGLWHLRSLFYHNTHYSHYATNMPFMLLYLFLLPLLVSLQLILFRSPFWLCLTWYGYNLSLLYISVPQMPWNISYFIQYLKIFTYIINQSHQASVKTFFSCNHCTLQPELQAGVLALSRVFCRAVCNYPNGVFLLDAAHSRSHLMPFIVGPSQKLYKINT